MEPAEEVPMKKLVVIAVKGMQKYENAEPDAVELVTEGWFQRDGARYTIAYEESELTGLDNTRTTIQADGDRLTMVRMGEFNAQMVFQEGRRHLSMYNTPYGSMAIGVNTHHLLVDLNDQGGLIEIDYAIEVDHEVAGRNVFRITVKEADSDSLKHK
jgi:uncharacterized beta-barrel protein YwiB (DUF1934 family)